jgi:hypothetical protein
MLEHYFWLLEFKFMFEFYCLNRFLNPFSKLVKPSLLSLSLPSFLARFCFRPIYGKSAGAPLSLQRSSFTAQHPRLRSPAQQLLWPAPARQPSRPHSRLQPAQLTAAQLAFRPKPPPARSPPSRALCRWPVGPRGRPLPRVRLDQDTAAAARVRAKHASSSWPAPQGVRPGLFKSTAAP